jgi:sigma-E factor negative regulatory protein RseA
MNTNEMTREQISALTDGELTDPQADLALAALRQPEARADWEIYHQIGDVLRSDDMAVTMSSGFAARMAARLELEPAIVAPAHAPFSSEHAAIGRAARISASVDMVSSRARRWAVPGVIAAAVASAAFIATPQLMVAMKGEPAPSVNESMVASTGMVQQTRISNTATETGQLAAASSTVSGEVVLRDPRIDDYLLAHQRFSPSMYSTAQFARSATFETAPGK